MISSRSKWDGLSVDQIESTALDPEEDHQLVIDAIGSTKSSSCSSCCCLVSFRSTSVGAGTSVSTFEVSVGAGLVLTLGAALAETAALALSESPASNSSKKSKISSSFCSFLEVLLFGVLLDSGKEFKNSKTSSASVESLCGVAIVCYSVK
ncbi:hypothetical protein WICPIJ_003818 [Wickerhamomyces pijperi]|uniref:Uncharacterized protein n=1 Tax=Wickerhamomyces pijperi TaxID=599730 RepID=A0A9P8Q978_WICPI|nr:hypothetical protein WICPIJ_003818 [Wickerhamomyces pijperi]